MPTNQNKLMSLCKSSIPCQLLSIIKVKICFGKRKIPLTMLVHDSAAMGYFLSPGLFELAQKLEHKGFDLADQHNF